MGRVALAVLLLASWAGPLSADVVSGRASARYIFTDSTSDKDGCDIALTRVRKQVLERVCGSQFSGGAGRFHSDDTDELSLFHFESVAGRVLNTRVEGKVVSMAISGNNGGDSVKQCTVSAAVEVACDRGRRDPAFAPLFSSDVKLNESVFRDGDPLQITMTAASGMYVNLFQYLPGERETEKVQRIFPNCMQREPFVKEGQELRIPDPSASDRYRLVMRLPQGKDRGAEELMMVATKKGVVFPDQMSLDEFQRLLAEIPLDERREAFLPYIVVRKGAAHGVQQQTHSPGINDVMPYGNTTPTRRY